MNLSQLYQEAREIAVEESLTDEDVALQGLNPSDPLEFVAGVGNHIFLFYSNLEPARAKSWDKMPAKVRKFYLRSTDYLAGIHGEPQ